VAFYPQRGAPLPIELANTVSAQDGQSRDALATPDDLAEWLRANASWFSEQSRAAATGQLGAFRALRDAVRQLLRAAVDGHPPPQAAIQVLNRLSAQAPYCPRLEWHDSEPRMVVETARADAEAVGIVTRASIALLAGPDRQRIGACQAPGCILFFLKQRRRRDWCSTSCGNRARVARHYRRHRGAALA
jgi:predicted RNA-binding Zn ribbon-like protein